MRRLTWSIIRRKFYDFFYNLKSATCKSLFIITPIILTKGNLLYLSEKRLVG